MQRRDIEALLRPAAFSHPAGDLTLRETHISWVILSGEFAYKIKKPVDFGFLDFSTEEKRRYFCEQELSLNRRFAPEIYLAVVPITRGGQGPEIDGTGPVIDHAVRMRRFDESQLLDRVAARGGLDRSLVRALAREISRLQTGARVCHPAAGSEEAGAPGALQAAVEQNFRQVRGYPLAPAEQDLLAHVEQWTRRCYRELLPILEQRVLEGRVIDGHGDAHLGNIALLDGQVRLFDCIEFNPALRIMDGIGEIAFLSMDLDARAYHSEARWLLNDWLEYGGDYGSLDLLNLYRGYFAMVRAKVALLRHPPAAHNPGRDSEAERDYREFCRYLVLARSYSAPAKPFLAITHGVSGSGKSTVADKLVAASGAIRIRSDVERKRLFGLAPEQRSRPQDEAELYSTAMSRRTFEQLERLASDITTAGFAVIVDATFLHRRVRDIFRRLAADRELPFMILDCVASPEELRRRLVAREQGGRDASEATVRVMESQLIEDQAPGGVERDCRIETHSGESASALWCKVQRFFTE